MISNKKAYAMKMLQLALALSLLHVDTDYSSLLQQRLRRWDAQLELPHGDGWELEMLRTVPMIESQHPYGNRKGVNPLIEDLLRYDEPPMRAGAGGEYKLPTGSFNASTFVMNLHNTTGNSSVQTAALQDLQSNSASAASASAVGVAGNAAASTVAGNGAGASALSEIHIDTNNGNENSLAAAAQELDIFLSPELLQDQRSIWEQNLADLHDYGDFPFSSPYANLPLKDGQQQAHNSSQLDLNLAAFLHGFAGNALAASNADAPSALNDSTPHPSNSGSLAVEQFGPDTDADDEDLFLTRLFGEDSSDSDTDTDTPEVANACEVEGLTSEEPYGIVNEVEIVQEESEIAEVLYKQDVDLGFSLDQEQIINASYASGNSGAKNRDKSDADKPGPDAKEEEKGQKKAKANDDTDKNADNNDDDDNIEKLKALQELRQDKSAEDEKDPVHDLDDLSLEWNGVPFTIDNETGEYVRLPLDELLNDVLQLSQFPLEDDELPNDSIASTSQAAAAAALNKPLPRIVSETGEDLVFSDPDSDLQDKQNNGNNNEAHFSGSDFEDLQDSVGSPLFDLDEEAKKELDEMLQSTAPPYHHHGHPHGPHPHSHHHAAAAAHHHHHAAHHAHHAHAAAAAAHQRAVQQAASANYATVGSASGSAFQRQPPTSAGFHHGHHQGRMPRLNRSVSMERLQDLATYFSPIPSMGVVGGVSDMPPYPPPPPPPHYSGYSYQTASASAASAQHAAQYGQAAAVAVAGGSLAPPPPPPHHGHGHGHHAMLHATNSALGDLCSAAAAGGQPHYGHNLGSAVSSSMHLTNSSHEADGAAAAAAAAAAAHAGSNYKMEHEMMYYANTSSDMNHTTDGFINSIFNDEDLHLMDMTDSFCRMVDNTTSNNSSVLGLPSSGHVSNAGSASNVNVNAVGAGVGVGVGIAGGIGGVGVGGAASMSGATAVGGGAGAGGMTSDLLANSAGAQGGGATDRLDASSDSAVSSMGSERVPSLSDGEWGEGSDSAQDYHQVKYGGPYDFSYNNTRQPPVAQKKHQLYGKRDLHKQTPPTAPAVATATAQTQQQQQQQQPQQAQVQSIKYEYEAAGGAGAASFAGGASAVTAAAAMAPALSKDYHQSYGMGASSAFTADYGVPRAPLTPHDLVQLNHTYSLPHGTNGALPQGSGSLARPQARDKKPVGGTKSIAKSSGSGSSNGSMTEEEHLSRDEKRARALNIPIPVMDIINLPMDEFNERLSKYDLSENQLSLIRDIRRRGKNKVAAQNCRKRKLDQILTLEDEVQTVVKRKAQLNQDHDHLDGERKRISNKFSMLHRHVFQYLRDPEGNPCSPADYSLQQAADGSVYLLPRDKSNDTAGAAAAVGAGAAGGAASSSSGQQLQSHQSHHQVQMPLQQQQQSRLPPHQLHHQQLLPQQQQQGQQQQQPPHQHQQQHHKE